MAAPRDCRLVLVYPAYRRWLTPDMSRLTFRIAGLDAAEVRDLDLRAQVTDTETKETNVQLFGLSEGSLVFDFPRLRGVHRHGEIRLRLENRETGAVLTEGTWKVEQIGSDSLTWLTYCDSRNVLLAPGGAFVPTIALSDADWTAPDAGARLAALATAGFSSVALRRPGLAADHLASVLAAATTAGLRVLVNPLPAPAGETRGLVERVRSLRGAGAILGYVVDVAAVGWEAARTAAADIRQTDSKRPILTLLPTPVDPEFLSGLEDLLVAAGPADTAASDLDRLAEAGRLALPSLDPASSPATHRQTFYRALLRGPGALTDAETRPPLPSYGVPGLVVPLGADSLLPPPALTGILREVAALTPMLTRGVPPFGAVAAVAPPAGVLVWQRSFEDKFLLAVLAEQPLPAGPATLPCTREGELIAVGQNRMVVVQDGRFADTLEPGVVRWYTNDAELANTLAQGT